VPSGRTAGRGRRPAQGRLPGGPSVRTGHSGARCRADRRLGRRRRRGGRRWGGLRPVCGRGHGPVPPAGHRPAGRPAPRRGRPDGVGGERLSERVMRVVIADDAVLLREGLVRLVEESGHTVVAVVGDGPSLVSAIIEHEPDVSIVDVRMPPTHTDEGLRAAVAARSRVPGSPILVLSQYVEVSYADDLLADRKGAIG